MAFSNSMEAKSTAVHRGSAPTPNKPLNAIYQWLVCAICAVALVMLSGLWITPNAYGDNSSDGSNSDSGTSSGVTITENITDTENLLGSHVNEVSDAIDNTEKETGVHVHLLFLSSFNSEQTPQKWAASVLESTDPDPNTVMLAVASNDGNLVVAVSSNSEEWLKKQSTVDELSAAAQKPLMESTPNWAGAATAMMDEIAKAKTTATSSTTVIIGVAVMAGVLVVLIVVIVVTMSIRRRRKAKGLPASKPKKGRHRG
ncbi:hypothetical protein G1C95_0822 [Bifidobacterium sp. DSM 109957]|uniref:TPM domain-containing protein n=1 Tax=Bifidobacterium oedipodis TaxID=2675322 RepID=A0A7Y0ENX6_9BIFI|nr:hypothetical protein [Bifidobacterium sp. DSM 109957]